MNAWIKRLLFVLVVVMVISGCAQPAPVATSQPATVATTAPVTASGQKLKVALVPPALVSPFYITLSNTVKDLAAKNPNVELTVVAPSAQTAIEEAIKIVEDLIQKKVNVIAIATSNWTALTPVLQKAREAGIEVILVDRVIPVDGLDALSMLGSDEIEGGRFVGEFVNKTLNGKGKVAILTGVTGSYHSERRLQGFHEIVDKQPGIEIITTQPANWERALAMTTTENILQAHQDIDFIWGLNDNMGLGALTAVTAANRQDKIKVIGYNGDKEAREAVKSGTLTATAVSQPVKIAEAIMTEIVPLLIEGKRSEVKSAYPIHVVLVTKENIDPFLQ